jgi:hypothetical protein
MLSEHGDKDLQHLDLWMKTNRPEAIFTNSPHLRRCLESLKYRIPQDVGLATTTVLDGKLDAGIDQNSNEIGRVGVEALTSLIHNNLRGIPDIPGHTLVVGKWVNGSTLPDKG